MKKRIGRILSCGVLVLTAVFVLSACGGGGGGGSTPSSGGSGGGMTYTGATQKAPVTNSTSKAILSDLYSDASSGNNLVGVSSQNGNGSNDQSGPSLLLIAKDLSDAAGRINASSSTAGVVQGATQSSTQTISGPCGGSATIEITVDTSNDTFSGTATFSNYCGLGLTVNGTGDYTGSVNSQGLPQQFSFSTNGLTAAIGAQSLTMAGSIGYSSITWDANTDMTGFTASENLYVDDADNVYWADNITLGCTFTYTSGSLSGIDLSIASGAFYDPLYGYVIPSTPTPFAFLSSNGWDYPSAGEITVTGANNSSAELSVPSYGYADIKVDADGNGVYEYDSGTIPWSQI